MSVPPVDPVNAQPCVICAFPCEPGRVTCGDSHHELFVASIEREFGTHKRVTDASSGITYLVPTRDIVENGLKFAELPRYPVAPAGG